MGALGGHMAHLHESIEMTFDELKNLLSQVANAELTDVTEKVDGQNLFLTVNEAGAVQTARNGGDLKTGGMTPEAFAAKWAGHPAETAFTNGFRAIEDALSSLPHEQLQELFAAGQRYVNMEIMYPGNPNLIIYDGANVVLHNLQTFDEAGEPVDDHPDARSAFDTLSAALDQAVAEVDEETWTINGPKPVELQALADGTALAEVQAAIDSIAAPVGTDATLEDFAEVEIREKLLSAGLPTAKVEEAIDAAFEREGAKKVVDIKRGLPKEQQRLISSVATKTNAYKAIASALRPLELAINEFAIAVLSGLQSFFIADENQEPELARQREELKDAIAHLEGLRGGNEKIGELVDKQLEKLGDAERVASTMEGVVFEYPPGSGQLKKLTGTFAMANQLVGASRRQPTAQEESVLRTYVRDMLFEAILNEQSPVDSKRVGLIPVSGKPYHAGHHYLVERAAAENEEVVLFVSTADRKRKGQFPILGSDMQRVWQEELEQILPSNVRVEYGGSPVAKVYDTIGTACEIDGIEETYVVYSDPEDTAQNYPQASRDKYMQPLCDHNQVIFAAEENPEAFSRGQGSPNVSGTKMRDALEAGNFEAFAAGMPSGVNAQNIWSILTHTTNEGRRKFSLVQAIFGGTF